LAREHGTCDPTVLTSEIQLDLLLSIYQDRLITTGQLRRHGLAAADQHRPWTEAVW